MMKVITAITKNFLLFMSIILFCMKSLFRLCTEAIRRFDYILGLDPYRIERPILYDNLCNDFV